ncbi:sodium/glutamate symporter [Veillonella magna]|uniref:sodium/glutamate symporter n=1 Tax=Veillonella magna TaxID=464322 RepID=UPI0026671655|nr:sodium/glutamate symporter [Veillonella magna]
MTFGIEKGVYTLSLGMEATLAWAIILLLIGRWLVQRVYVLQRFCIPAPVVGGLLFSLLTLFLHQTGLMAIKMTTTFQTPLMLGFFTTIGLIASLKLVKKGGKILFFYWLLCSILALMQNSIGVSLAEVLDIHPLLGVLMGAVSMEGGHGAAGAFGPEVEAMGIYGATAVAMAAATFGLVSGGLIGGPIANYLIKKGNLTSTELDENPDAVTEEAVEGTHMTASLFMQHAAVITVCMTVGLWVATTLKASLAIALPSYVGAMFFAVVVRNLNDHFHWMNLDNGIINFIGEICLGIFLSMALMTLRLWELADLALPMIIVLAAQVLFMVFYTVVIAFRVLGKTYDAAIICAGMAGHGLGATPNAIANMTAVTERFGPSTKAFLVVPLCGAFLIDLFGIPCITWFINYFAP